MRLDNKNYKAYVLLMKVGIDIKKIFILLEFIQFNNTNNNNNLMNRYKNIENKIKFYRPCAGCSLTCSQNESLTVVFHYKGTH